MTNHIIRILINKLCSRLTTEIAQEMVSFVKDIRKIDTIFIFSLQSDRATRNKEDFRTQRKKK